MDLNCINKKIKYTDTTAINVGYLPPNSYVVDIKVGVKTAFNAGGNDYIDLGITGTAAYYADDVNVASTGAATVTALKLGEVFSATNPTLVKAVYVPAGSTPSAGEAMITFVYAYQENA
jgi:N-acetylneuraminic acid mutarotase